MKPRLAVCLVACAALSFTHCKRPARAPDAPSQPLEQSTSGADSVGIGAEAIADPAEVLPARTLMLLTGSSIERFAHELGRDQLVARHPDVYAKAVESMLELTGHNLLDPTRLADVGVDPDARFGFVLLDTNEPTLAGFASLTDPDVFKNALWSAAATRQMSLAPTAPGPGMVIEPEPRDNWAIAIRGKLALVVTSSAKGRAHDVAVEIAQMSSADSLAQSAGYVRAHADLGPAGDANGYADLAGLLRGQLERMARFETETENWAHKSLVEARERGAPATEIKELERHAADFERSRQTRQKRRRAERNLIEEVFGPASGLAYSGRFGDRQFVGRLTLPMAEDALVRRVVRPDPAPSALLGAIDKPLLFVLGGGVDVESALELVELAARADGLSLSEADAELRKEAGFDLSKDVRTALTGGAAVAVTAASEPNFERPNELRRSIGFAAIAGIKDRRSARRMLDRMAKRARRELKVRARPDLRGYVFEPKDWRPIYVGIAGDYLAASTDPKVLHRVASGKPSTKPGGLRNASAQRVLEDSEATMLYGLDASVVSLMTLRSFMQPGVDIDTRLADLGTASELRKIPRSRAVRAKQRELDKLDKKLGRAQLERDAERARATYSLTRKFGAQAARLDERPSGFVAEGGQYFSERLPDLIEATLDSVMGRFQAIGPDARVDGLWQRHFELEQELIALRRKDIERHRAKRRK